MEWDLTLFTDSSVARFVARFQTACFLLLHVFIHLFFPLNNTLEKQKNKMVSYAFAGVTFRPDLTQKQPVL